VKRGSELAPPASLHGRTLGLEVRDPGSPDDIMAKEQQERSELEKREVLLCRVSRRQSGSEGANV
jgi:hypothetical protein